MQILIVITFAAAVVFSVQSQSDSNFIFSRGPVPNPFLLHQHYPDRPESVECRPIRLHIERGSRRFVSELVTNEHTNVQFTNADARIMSSRLHRHLNELAETFYETHNVWITVIKAWAEQGDTDVTDTNSLHYEGRTVRVRVDVTLISSLLQLAIEVGFDWVYYASEEYVRMSVIPNLCDVSLDMVFMLDRSGSVGEENFDTAITFLQNVVNFFTVARDATRVGLVTYSTDAAIEFDLNDFETVEDVRSALDEVIYTEGWTATDLALRLTRSILDPEDNYGARPFVDGIPKVAVLLTDGRSNQLPIINSSNNLRNFGVQVYTIGIGDIYLPELKFIASNPDEDHVFLLNSFNDAPSFVDLLSFTTCDAPAVVEPGEDTRIEIEEEEFRFFQSGCAAFSDVVMIEQIDLVGQCSLYASSSVPNPGPLDPPGIVERNEDPNVNFRSVHVTLPHTQDRFVYVSVLGKHRKNEFTLVIWDMIFEQDEYTRIIQDSGNTMGQVIINLVDQIREETNAQFIFEITEGNEDGIFALDSMTGILTLTMSSTPDSTYTLNIIAQNKQHDCHRSKVVVNVVVMEEVLQFDPLPEPVSISETASVGDEVTTISASSSVTTSLTYSITSGNDGNAFSIDSSSGVITIANPLNFEVISSYSLIIQVMGSSTAIIAQLEVIVNDVDEPPVFITPCALNNDCSFSVPENEPGDISVGTVLAEDPDRPPTLTYSLELSTAPFQISQMGEISTTGPLDFEITTSYTITVLVTDDVMGELPFIIQILVIVNVMNVEENQTPQFVTNCSIAILEDIRVDQPFFRCVASDADEQGNVIFDITYEIIDGNVNNAFQVDPVTAIFSPAISLDREDIDRYTLTLQANDSGGLTDTTIVTVTIIDVNDSPPLCEPPLNNIVITPDSLPSPVVTTFTANDPDINPLRPVFSIESVTMQPLTPITTIIIRTTDGEDASLFSTCTLTIEFEMLCLEQVYDINSDSGVLSAMLLCNAFIIPETLLLTFGRSLEIECIIISNIVDDILYRFLLNGTEIAPFNLANNVALLTIDFDDSGDYTCEVTNPILGTISSPPNTLSVRTIPVITTPPSDMAVQSGEDVMFECFTTGIPDPTITWFRPNGEQVIGTEDPRFIADDSNLTIINFETQDDGEYTCRATNSAGSDSATAQLTVFMLQQLVMAEVPEYLLPAQDNSCHEFNTTEFNWLMSQITGHDTQTTAQISKDLCPPSSCNPSPCKNEGVCVSDVMAPGGFICECNIQYVGQTCEEVTDPCLRTPCYNDGICASTSRGDFLCSCPNGYHGDRCQYMDVCQRLVPCQQDEICLETVVRSEGYVCVSGEMGEGVTVSVETGGAKVTSQLDGLVNEYIESAADLNRRRRRNIDDNNLQDNGFVTVCEARFIPSSTSLNTFVLVWACPDGVPAPDGADEEAICELMIEQRLVTSCTSSHGGTIELSPFIPLPPTSVNITFLLFDPSTNQPLSSSAVLIILEQTNALAKLNTTIYKTSRFSAVATPTDGDSTKADNSGRIAGAVIGSLVFVIILMVAIVTVVYIIRQQKPIFDDPVYEVGYGLNESNTYQPPVTTTTNSSSSLERGMRSSLERGITLIRSRVSNIRRSEPGSCEMLLSQPSLDDSGDYDDIMTTPTSNGSVIESDEIYANIAHERKGAMGNAGQRWQSYWQTNTLIRTNPSESNTNKQ